MTQNPAVFRIAGVPQMKMVLARARAGDPWALRARTIRGQDLSGMDFSGLRFDSFTFEDCRLDNCNFRGADFADLCIKASSAREADFRDSTGDLMLTDVVAPGIDFRNVALQAAGLVHVDIHGGHLDGADFRGGGLIKQVRACPGELAGCYPGRHKELAEIATADLPPAVRSLARAVLDDWDGTVGDAIATAELMHSA